VRTRGDFTDRERLLEQYGDSLRFRTRVDAHREFGERKESFHAWLVDRLDPQSGDHVADVGCGPGDYFQLLAGRGARVVGCDLSPGMAQEARRAGFRTVVADAQHLPLASGTFERVMCNHVLYHVPDQRAALLELHRIARPGGTVLIATNGTDTLREFDEVARQAGRDLGHELPARRRSPFTLEDGEVVRSVFPSARVERFENRLVFPEPEPAIDYLRSWIGGTGPLEDAMRRRIAGVIEREGAFRVDTIAGCFVAEV